jgi:hypothetical protein
MKKAITILLSFITLATAAFSQTKTAEATKLEALITALDKAGWEAWKNKDVSWFQANAAEDFLSISSEGISNKADVIKSVPIECDIKSYSLDDFGFVELNKNTVVITYIATQEGICGGKKNPAKVRASATYIK